MIISKRTYEKKHGVKLKQLTLEDLAAHSKETLVVKLKDIGYVSATIDFMIGSDDLNYIEFVGVNGLTIHVRLKDIDKHVFVGVPNEK